METSESRIVPSYGILSGSAIAEAVACGDIKITPFNPNYVNGASYDVCLGKKFAVYERWVEEFSDREKTFYKTGKTLDTKNEKHFGIRIYDIPENGIELQPFILYLMHTEEAVRTDKYEPVLDGRSSVGRLGLFIHITAAYGDPFYDGQYTLEVMAIHPIKLYAGTRIGQMRFHTLVGEPVDYRTRGNYVGDAAHGPVASRLYRQFK